ncbi:MAG: extensin family protein, partial [Caulobacteraceae bacterium]|nr:extensin family protein [Caulobacter sp.]
PSGATTAFTPRSPQEDPQCPARLQGLKVDVAPTDIGPQPDARCTVVQPVRLSAMTRADGGRIEFPEHPLIACTTADAFTAYLRDLMAPLTKGTFGAPLTAVWTGPGLECRSRDHVFGAKLSAHGQGLAIDIAQLKLGDGRLVEVGTPKTDAETRFETAARAGACGFFHTVLGPGSDAYHRTHWHFDLEVRGKQGDSKYCK